MKILKEHLKKYEGAKEYSIIKNYLDKYWLDESEYINYWSRIKQEIFCLGSIETNSFRLGHIIIPTIAFNKNFSKIYRGGGILFTKEEFIILKKCCELTKDKYFVIIEEYNEEKPPHNAGPLFRFKFPINISWDELLSGSYISNDVFNCSVRNYYVFGNTGNWGMYVPNDYEYPIEIIGFKKQFEKLFRNSFPLSEEDKNYLAKYYPKLISERS